MRREALSDVRAAIEANTKRRSLDELKAEGKRHVRVVSGEKVMEIIQAVVGDIVSREVGKLTKKDRERIAKESKAQFDRVMKTQADQDAVIQEQKMIIGEYKVRVAELETLFEEAKQEHAAAQRRLEAEFQARLEKLDREGGASAERLAELETRLANAKTTIGNYDAEISRLTHRINEDGDLLEELKSALQAKELEVQRLTGERDTLARQLEAAREAAGESEAVQQLRGELSEMKSFLRNIEQRAGQANDETVAALLQRLEERESFSTASLEERFQATLDKSLDQITRTMEAATAKPIDVAVEATDAVVARLFDAGERLESNLDELDVEEKTTKSSIASNIERLRAMRAGQPEPAPAEESTEEVSREAARKTLDSVERLKAVREAEEGGDES